jgi:hypothetical protein
VLGVAEKAALVGERGGVSHVNGDGMAVTKWCLGDKFVER